MPDVPVPQRPRPRKQPKQARSEASVIALVEAAARILERFGPKGFSTNSVAELAGVSIGSLYQYFPNKEALLGALIVRETNILIAEAEAALHEPTGHAALETLIQACAAHQMRRPALARLLDFEEARLPLDADTKQVGARFQATVERLLRRPDLPPQPKLTVAARDIMAIIRGMIDTAGEHGETDQRSLVIRVEKAVLGYLKSNE